MNRLVSRAWKAFDQAGSLRTEPSVPILFFGDLQAYWASELRVLTVGLNPSWKEFPPEDPFQRFPKADRIRQEQVGKYLEALSEYFQTDPYRSWFGSFEPILNGLGASYYFGEQNRALHTNICSVVATDRTWSRIDDSSRIKLQTEGNLLWHDLVRALEPHVVLISVARLHLSRIGFEPMTRWKVLRLFDRQADGSERKRPYRLEGRWYRIGWDLPALFVFGPAAQTPFGLLGNQQKHLAGQAVQVYWNTESR